VTKHDCEVCENLYTTERQARRCADRHRREWLGRLAASYSLGQEWTLATYPVHDTPGRQARALVRDWIDGDWTQNIYIDGPVGTGKTGLLVAACRDLIRTYSIDAIFVNARDLLAQLRHGYTTGQPSELASLCERAELLALDDLGAEKTTEWGVETLTQIIDGRYSRRAPIFVSSNLDPAGLIRHLGRHDFVAGQRLVSRLLHNAVRIHIDRPDLRLAQLRLVETDLPAATDETST
jgi:DNA replication protein DnaC